MQQRQVNREINNEFVVAGLTFPALLMIFGIIAVFVATGAIVSGFVVGAAAAYLLRRFLKNEPAALDWLITTLKQRKSYGLTKENK